MARHFGYYDDWKTPILVCACGWTGTFEQGSVGHFEALMDSSCPRCEKMLAIVPYPTIKESEQHWDQLSDKEKQAVSARKRFLADWEAASLKSTDQLPDVEGEAVSIAWDMVGREGDAREGRERLYTVLRHGEQELFREMACWEGYERFQEIVKILQAKYGSRLVDVIPTRAATTYLYGDSLAAIQMVQEVREALIRAFYFSPLP
jgi:hypothetical protein